MSIVDFPGITRLGLPPERVHANVSKVERVPVIDITAEGAAVARRVTRGRKILGAGTSGPSGVDNVGRTSPQNWAREGPP